MSKKRRLGKGLGALLGESDTGSIASAVVPVIETREGQPQVVVDKIRPNRYQPRRTMNPETISELALSIKAQGLIQPLVVNDSGDGTFELISGERRLRAVKRLGWKTVPAVIRRVGESELLEMTLVENLQREDLNPIEEATGYQRLSEEFQLTQAQIAERMGKDRATIANTMRLLKLPEVIKQEVASGALSAGHARQLLAVDNRAEQVELARRVIHREISVRKLEEIVRGRKKRPEGLQIPGGERKKEERPTQILALEERLRRHLGTQVRIRNGNKGIGKIEVDFYSFEEFERLMELLGVPLA